jgi:transposase
MLRIEEATTRRDTFIARGMGRSFQEGFTRLDAAIPLRVVTFAAGADAVDQSSGAVVGISPSHPTSRLVVTNLAMPKLRLSWKRNSTLHQRSSLETGVMVEYAHQHLIGMSIKSEAPMLFQMSMTIMVTDDELGFVTSDKPCLWFNPSLQHLRPQHRERTAYQEPAWAKDRDVQECQWLLQLRTFGLLNNSFRPPEEICVLRAYWRRRAEHVASASTCIQRMQKVLTEMNVQLANVISDISGLTGLAIIQAILAGERDRYKLADLANFRIQASRGGNCRSLEGNWRKELLFILQQELNLYQTYQQQIAECDTALAAHLQTLEDKVEAGSQPPAAKANKRAGGNAPTSFDLRGGLYRISGTDLTQIDGINIMNAQTIIAEVGVDMSRFPSEAHFASFLGLCPDNQITGGEVLRRGTRHVENRAATAFRMAASTSWRSTN